MGAGLLPLWMLPAHPPKLPQTESCSSFFNLHKKLCPTVAIADFPPYIIQETMKT
jgi:hypothetical protein